MRKVSHRIVTVGLLFFISACSNVLDIEPENIIGSKDVFSNESGIEAYLATLYKDLPIEDFNFAPRSGFRTPYGGPGPYLCHLTGEALNTALRNRNSIGDGTWLQWWNYSAVRNVNDFIVHIQKGDFPQKQKNEWLGEAKFIRAYYYFGLVKRYGGVPLITEVQHYNGKNLDSLQVPRNTEKEVYDFINSELDEAASLMGETSEEKGRANKYVAYALKSRAMLYAAAEAEYGNVALNGLVGIPAADADRYWQEAYDAAQKVIDSKKYSLYNKKSDKEENFASMFLDEDNPEAVFTKYFSYPQKVHRYDLYNQPHALLGHYGSHIAPTLELVEEYEYIDGSQGTLKLTDNQGNPIEYKNPVDLFKNKDPRFAATVLYPFAPWEGTIMEVRAGIIDNGKTITSGDYNTLYKGMHIIGRHGIGGGEELSLTGFYIRKYLDPTYGVEEGASNTNSDQAFIDIRYAEVLLNYAEAAAELGKIDNALSAINKVRDRAGIALLDASEVTIDRIRHEREVEFAFENKRYWDIRRWHIADKIINNTKFSRIEPYYVMKDSAYIFKRNFVGYSYTFNPKLYYERIPPGEIAKDPKLIQNPNY